MLLEQAGEVADALVDGDRFVTAMVGVRLGLVHGAAFAACLRLVMTALLTVLLILESLGHLSGRQREWKEVKWSIRLL